MKREASHKPAVSILMPSLNVGPFIELCMQSVVGQTLHNIEVICIDAGSTDGTLEVLREYEQRDARVRVIVSPKKSYGHQMNLGLDAARGEYIGIVETDDWAEPNMFEALLRAAKAAKADVAKSNYYEYRTSVDKSDVLAEPLAPIGDAVFVPRENLEFIGAPPAIWSGIYRREMLEEAGVRFNESPGASYQDTAFYLMVCAAAKSAIALQEGYLHYRVDNEESSVKSAGKVYCICDEMRVFEEWLNKRGESNILPRFMITKFKKYLWNYRRLAPEYKWEFLCAAHREFVASELNGSLDKSLFSPAESKSLELLLRDPVGMYLSTCGPHAMRLTSRELLPAEVVARAEEDCPLVSVVLAARDEEGSIRRMLEAFAIGNAGSENGEFLSLVELLCVDDGSSDNTLRVMEEFARNNRNVTVLRQVPEGHAAAWDHGIAAARGEYVLLMRTRNAIPPAKMLVEAARKALASDANLIVAECYGDDPANGAEWLADAFAANKPWGSLSDKMLRRKLIVDNDLILCGGFDGLDELFVLELLCRASGVEVAGKWLLDPSYGGMSNICTMLRIAIELPRVVGALPYDEGMQRAAVAEVERLSRRAATSFAQLSAEGAREVKRELSPIEWHYLAYCLDHVKLAQLRESQVARVAKKVKSRVGRVRRSIVRRIR
ncbi:MAG: glycosyltransferase [Atopobiaceae bacterium]|nr:glycosyltransferase [Atopobiaceae bacterium]